MEMTPHMFKFIIDIDNNPNLLLKMSSNNCFDLVICLYHIGNTFIPITCDILQFAVSIFFHLTAKKFDKLRNLPSAKVWNET